MMVEIAVPKLQLSISDHEQDTVVEILSKGKANEQVSALGRCIQIANQLERILPGRVEDENASKLWTAVGESLLSLKKALMSSMGLDGDIQRHMLNAKTIRQNIKKRLQPYMQVGGMRLKEETIDIELEELKKIQDDLGKVIEEVKTAIECQDFSEQGAIQRLFPSDTDGCSMEDMYAEINEKLEAGRKKWLTLVHEERELKDALDDGNLELMSATAQLSAEQNRVGYIRMQLADAETNLDCAKAALKKVEKGKLEAGVAIQQLQDKATLENLQAQQEREQHVVMCQYTESKWVEEQERVLRRKRLGTTGGIGMDGNHIIFILDKSSSMQGNPWSHLRTAFTTFIQERKKQGRNDVISTILFGSNAEIHNRRQQLQSDDISLPQNCPGGGTSFSSGWVEAERQAKEFQKGATVVIFMTDGFSSQEDVQCAASAAENMYKQSACMTTFGVTLGTSKHQASVTHMVRAGNGGKATLGRNIEPVLHSTQAGDLSSKFEQVLQSLNSIEEELQAKVRFVEEEVKKIQSKTNNNLESLKASHELQQKLLGERTRASLESNAEPDVALQAYVERHTRDVRDLQAELAAAIAQEEKAKNAVVKVEQLQAGIQGKIDDKSKQMGLQLQQINNEGFEVIEQIRKRYQKGFAKLEETEKFLGTTNPALISELKTTIHNFGNAKRWMEQELKKKLSYVQGFNDLLRRIEKELYRLVKGDGPGSFSLEGKVQTCLCMLQQLQPGLELELNSSEPDHKTFMMIVKMALGPASDWSDERKLVFDAIDRCGFTLHDFLYDEEPAKKAEEQFEGLKERISADIEVTWGNSASDANVGQAEIDDLVGRWEQRVNEKKTEIETLTVTRSDEQDREKKAQLKEQIEAAKESLTELKQALKEAKDEAKEHLKTAKAEQADRDKAAACERKAKLKLIDPVLDQVLEIILRACRSPLYRFTDIYVVRGLSLAVDSSRMISTYADSYGHLVDELPRCESIQALGANGGGGYPQRAIEA